MLQRHLFSYGDTQRYRLGVNHWQIPVNYPRGVKHFHPYHRDGGMRVDGNMGSAKTYKPNSYGEWQEQPEYKEPPLQLNGDDYEWNFREDDDDYEKDMELMIETFNKLDTAIIIANLPDFTVRLPLPLEQKQVIKKQVEEANEVIQSLSDKYKLHHFDLL